MPSSGQALRSSSQPGSRAVLIAPLSQAARPAAFLGPVPQLPCGLRPVSSAPASQLLPSCLSVLAWWGFPSAWVQRPVLSIPSSQEGLAQECAWRPVLPPGSLLCLVPSGALMPLGFALLPHRCPSRPGQGLLWLLTEISPPTLSGQPSLPPPHTQTSRPAALSLCSPPSCAHRGPQCPLSSL